MRLDLIATGCALLINDLIAPSTPSPSVPVLLFVLLVARLLEGLLSQRCN